MEAGSATVDAIVSYPSERTIHGIRNVELETEQFLKLVLHNDYFGSHDWQHVEFQEPKTKVQALGTWQWKKESFWCAFPSGSKTHQFVQSV
jgi:hypothetical protein